MSLTTVSWSMGFSDEEKVELLGLVASNPKWTQRINEAFGHVINVMNRPPPLAGILPIRGDRPYQLVNNGDMPSGIKYL